ncbi:MAG: VCBS repeat-containing protein [Bacteroidales bacterium]|nr:VCBS repeat-containing protein [Bacteroidales bacterium]
MKKILLILTALAALAFKTGDTRSNYTIPRAAWSVTAGDIDLDGDNDIIVGHKTAWQNNNTSITLLENTNSGIFAILDTTIVFCGYQENIFTAHINNDNYPDIVSFMSDFSSGIAERYIRVFYNYGGAFEMFQDFSLNSSETFSDINYGDFNNDSYTDIIIASNNGQFWGVMYNDGTGNFSEPEYTYVNGYFPTAIACGDLNSDNRNDIVVCGQSTEVYFSYPDGFQSLILETNNFKEGVSIVDFDLDGDNDILTFVGIPIIGITSLIMYENKGNNIFDTLEEFYFQPMSSRFFVTDFNNNSLQDILFQLSDKSGYIIYYNQGDFQLADSQFVALPPSNPQEGWRNGYCADMDGNGYNDIITVKTLYAYLPDNLEILFNDGNGNFVEDPITIIKNPEPESQNPLSCYPNPFTTETTFQFTIEQTALAELSVYDLRGSLIISLTNKIRKGGQLNTIKWDGLDAGGKPNKPGPYIAYLKVNGKVRQSVKLIKLN